MTTTQIKSTTAIATSSVNFTSDITSTYPEYLVKMTEVSVDKIGCQLDMLCGVGGEFDQDSEYYNYFVNYSDFKDGADREMSRAINATYIKVAGINVTTGPPQPDGLYMHLRMCPGGSISMSSRGNLTDDDGDTYKIEGSGTCTLDNIDSLRFYSEAGGLISGTFTLYGIGP